MTAVVLGVDIGTSSSKGALVDLEGRLLASATRTHTVSRPRPGHVEMGGDVWWDEFVALSRELLSGRSVEVQAVGVSGMGPCVLLVDEGGAPLRPAILYGVDTRSTSQIVSLTERYGDEAIRARCGSSLTTQAAGAKVAWVAEQEPELFARARRLFMPSSWLAYKLTGTYVLDHHSASQSTPLYDVAAERWYQPWVDDICPDLEMPPLQWSNEVAGAVQATAAELTGIPEGTPVITGTIDAWAEALSVDAHNVGDLMLMYGTTMFLVNTIAGTVTSPTLWGTVGALRGTRNLAGGMATSGAITTWLRDLFGDVDYADLVLLAKDSPPGANGLLMLPYFAGERTPVMDAQARGLIAGLSLTHTRGDLYRAALEATGFAVRHNIEAIEAAGGDVRRIVAVGGGTQGDLWTQIVSDITGREQVIPTQTIGASYGGALLAAQSVADVSAAAWNPVREIRKPAEPGVYEDLYRQYLELYPSTREISHALAERQVR
jgi:xylulokinase